MTDTSTVLTPASAGAGTIGVNASAPLFAAGDLGRGLSIRQIAPERAAATAYSQGAIFYSEYNSVDRVYRVINAGTTAAANLAGTTPNYDLNAPRDTGDSVIDGTCTLLYLGPGKVAWGFGVIAAVIDAQNVQVAVDPRGPFTSNAGTQHWRLGEWSPSRGYPRAVTFFQQRTIWGGSIAKPQTLWTSNSGDFETMSPGEPDGTVLDTDSITETIDDDQVNTIIWMSPIQRGIAIGTPSGEFLVSAASSTQKIISPNNISADREADRGSANIAGIRISGAVLFVQVGARKLRELVYDFQNDAFATTDLTQLADHIAGAGFVDMAYQARPEGTLWLVRKDGQLVTLTYDREQKVRAWARQIIAGTKAGPALVESVCCVPSPDGTEDDVYICVARNVDGVLKRSIEFIRPPFRADIDGDGGGFFVDAGLTYSGPPVNVFTGLTHLEGETVSICADGAARPDAVVTNGTVSTKGAAASLVHIGLPCPARVRTLPPEGQASGGSTMGKPKRITEAIIRFSETRGGQIGRDGVALEPLQMRRQPATLSAAAPLWSSDYRMTFPNGTDITGIMDIVQPQPLPMTVLAIVTDLQTNA